MDFSNDPALLFHAGSCHLDALQLLQLRLKSRQPAHLTRSRRDSRTGCRRPAHHDEEEHQVVEPVIAVVVSLVGRDEDRNSSDNSGNGPVREATHRRRTRR